MAVPVTSQIPGLNSDLPPEEDIQRSMFRDTDTKYVRLAKSGGRQSKLTPIHLFNSSFSVLSNISFVKSYMYK